MTEKRLYVRWDCNLQRYMYYVNINGEWRLIQMIEQYWCVCKDFEGNVIAIFADEDDCKDYVKYHACDYTIEKVNWE